jgi:predicted DNA-binding transcriptional regulator
MRYNLRSGQFGRRNQWWRQNLPKQKNPTEPQVASDPLTQYIPIIENMSTHSLNMEQRQFIEDLGRLLVAWGQPSAAARLYGYLLLRNEPASLDDIARDLEISKTSAFGAVAELERQRNLRRLSERGSKRAYFVLTDDPGAPLRNQVSLLGMMETLIASKKDRVATGQAAIRMAALAAFHERLRIALQQVVT